MANRIRELRKSKKMTMKELGTVVGLAESTISQYETGKRQPDNETLLKLGEFFGVTVDYILGGKNWDAPHVKSKFKGARIPVLGSVPAGIPMEAIEDIVDYEEIDEALAATGEFFGLRIRGDSMEPRMVEGDVVIVRLQDDVDSGDTAIVLVNGNEATCKKIKKTPDGVMLIPTNPAHEPWFYSNEEIQTLPVRILGKVVELRAKY